MKFTLQIRLFLTLTVIVLVCLHLLWDHFHGGVPTHYILQSDDMPGFSNWWGIITLPLLTWLVLYRIRQREAIENSSEIVSRKVIYRFVSALLLGIIMMILFTIESTILDYMILGFFLIAFFMPIYFLEYLLGFVIGTTYTVGTIIPIVFGGVLILLFRLIYELGGLIQRMMKLKKVKFL